MFTRVRVESTFNCKNATNLFLSPQTLDQPSSVAPAQSALPPCWWPLRPPGGPPVLGTAPADPSPLHPLPLLAPHIITLFFPPSHSLIRPHSSPIAFFDRCRPPPWPPPAGPSLPHRPPRLVSPHLVLNFLRLRARIGSNWLILGPIFCQKDLASF